MNFKANLIINIKRSYKSHVTTVPAITGA